MKVHELKCWPGPFAALAAGRKTAEVRRNDRGFDNGDLLVLREWKPDPESGPVPSEWHHTGRWLIFEITHVQVLDGFVDGAKGFVLLSLGRVVLP